MRNWLWIVPLAAIASGTMQQPVILTAMAAPMGAAAAGVNHPPVRAMIPSGTPLNVRIDQALDTDRNRAGDPFTATLIQPVQHNGKVLIPAGTQFHGHVTNATSSKRLTGKAQLGIVLDTFQLRGRSYRVTTSSVDRLSSSHKKRNRILIGGGAGVGTLFGALAGGGAGALIGAGAGAGAGVAGAALTGKKEVGIDAETPLTFTLQRPVAME